MSASERVVRRTGPSSGRDGAGVRGPSMGELLASCAAARAVSTPPRATHGAGQRDLGHCEEEPTTADTTSPAGAREGSLRTPGA